MNHAGIAGSVLLVLCGTFGCSSSRTQAQAREFTDGYYALLQADRVDDALELCEPGFFKRTPRENWITARQLVDDRLGAIESFAMAKWTMELLPNGTFVTFEYDVVYQHGTSRDTITVVDPIKNPGFKVYGHHVHSDQL